MGGYKNGKVIGADLILPEYVELEAAKAARNAALRSLDISWAKKVGMVAVGSDEQILICLHMARYECDEIEDRLRFQSRDFLKARGMGRLHGLPFEEGDKLPTGLV